MQVALAAGNLDDDSASARLNTMADACQRTSANALALHQAENNRPQLLGLAPMAPLKLVGAPYVVDPDITQLAAALADLPKRHADLLALQAGYRTQEATLADLDRAVTSAATIQAMGRLQDHYKP